MAQSSRRRMEMQWLSVVTDQRGPIRSEPAPFRQGYYGPRTQCHLESTVWFQHVLLTTAQCSPVLCLPFPIPLLDVK